jgi:hypothetical protein
MQPLNYQTTSKTTAPLMPKKPARGHGFLISLVTLMVVSLGVWGYFVYLSPSDDSDSDSYATAPAPQHVDTASLDSDLNAAGTIDNSNDLKDIDQAFK